ncbi:hypothetical protein BGX26_008440, partial [Mortierella sp. AD094]
MTSSADFKQEFDEQTHTSSPTSSVTVPIADDKRDAQDLLNQEAEDLTNSNATPDEAQIHQKPPPRQFALIMVAYGKFSDIFGRKVMILFANTLFLIGSAISGWATSITMLIIGRGVAGIGAG